MAVNTHIGASPGLAAILDSIDRFLARWPLAATGPAHVILSDYNWLDANIDFCLRVIARNHFAYEGGRGDEAQATWDFLRALRDTPERERVAAMEELLGGGR